MFLVARDGQGNTQRVGLKVSRVAVAKMQAPQVCGHPSVSCSGWSRLCEIWFSPSRRPARFIRRRRRRDTPALGPIPILFVPQQQASVCTVMLEYLVVVCQCTLSPGGYQSPRSHILCSAIFTDPRHPRTARLYEAAIAPITYLQGLSTMKPRQADLNLTYAGVGQHFRLPRSRGIFALRSCMLHKL
jgi:hypothetical protein